MYVCVSVWREATTTKIVAAGEVFLYEGQTAIHEEIRNSMSSTTSRGDQRKYSQATNVESLMCDQVLFSLCLGRCNMGVRIALELQLE